MGWDRRSFFYAVRRTSALWGALAAAGAILWLVHSCPCVSVDAVPLMTVARAWLKLTGQLVFTALIEIVGLTIALALWGVLKSARSPDRQVEVTVPTKDQAFALAAYAHADGAYRNPNDSPFRYVERFWFAGGVLGLVHRDAPGDTTYVVFRGTSEAGNWFLTNAQAHLWKASSVFGDSVPGGVHGGFAKAHFDLWLGKADPPFSRVRSYDATKFLWPVYMAALTSPGWAPWYLRPAELQALSLYCMLGSVVVTLLVIQFVFSHGFFEHSFLRPSQLPLGTPLRDTLLRHSSRRVVFVGHSLGGALATLAFVDFCERQPTHEVELVTFGAPQVGNDEFIDWLASRGSPGQISVFANLGDPVAHMPPSEDFPETALRRVTSLGALLTALYFIGWLPYAKCYQVSLGCGWARLISWRGRDEGISISQHSEY